MKKTIICLCFMLLVLFVVGCSKPTSESNDNQSVNNYINNNDNTNDDDPPPSIYHLRYIEHDYSGSNEFGVFTIEEDGGYTILGHNGPSYNVSAGIKEVIFNVSPETALNIFYARNSNSTKINYTVDFGSLLVMKEQKAPFSSDSIFSYNSIKFEADGLIAIDVDRP